MACFLCGEEKAKHLVRVHLHYTLRNLKNMIKMSTLPPWKNFCGRACWIALLFNFNHISV